MLEINNKMKENLCMDSINRRIEIFNILSKNKSVNIVDLANRFSVTTMTIRRDLKEFEKQGIASLYYGGATLNENGAIETSFSMRKPKQSNEKYYIAYEASRYIKDGDTVYIDGGSTCYYICKFLKNRKITILTNSIRAVEALKECNYVKTIIAPGEYSSIQEITLGYSTILFLKEHHVNKAFISATGINGNGELTMSNETEAQLKREILKISDIKVLLADHSKFNQKYFVAHGKISDFNILITDNHTDLTEINRISKKTRVVVVDINKSRKI